MKKYTIIGLYIAACICFLNAIWTLFAEQDKLLFLSYLQTGLLFSIFAFAIKKLGQNKRSET